MLKANRLLCFPMTLTLGTGFLIGCNVNVQVDETGGNGATEVDGTEGPGSGGALDISDDALADFSAVDANPNSARFQEAVSPRDYASQVTAWYFGHST